MQSATTTVALSKIPANATPNKQKRSSERSNVVRNTAQKPLWKVSESKKLPWQQKKRILLAGPPVRFAKGPPQGLQGRLRGRSEVLQNASKSLPRGVLQVEALKTQFLINVLHGIHVFEEPKALLRQRKTIRNGFGTSTGESW